MVGQPPEFFNNGAGWRGYAPGMELAQALERGVSVHDSTISEADEALAAMASVAARELGIDRAVLHEALRRRERILPTAMPEGIAFPHVILPEITRALVVPMSTPAGVQMAAGEPPSTLIIGLFAGPGNPRPHLRLLSRLARIANDPEALRLLRAAPNADELVHAMLELDAQHA